MARKVILKDNGLNGVGNTPTGYSYLGKDGTTLSEKIGATVSVVGGGGSNYESITHSALTTLISGSGLTEGKFYLISDYKSIYVQPDFSDIDTAVIVSASLIKEGVIEPLIVFATSTNTISSQAWSTTFPDDTIYYDVTVETLFTGYDTKGKIIRRIDKVGNDISFDFRNVKFKKYPSVSYDGYDSYNNGNPPAEHYVFTPWDLQLDSYQNNIKNNKISYGYDVDYDNYTNGISDYNIWGVNIVIYIGTSAINNEIAGFIPNIDIAADQDMMSNKINGRIRSLYLEGSILNSNIINSGNSSKAIIKGSSVISNEINGSLYLFTLASNDITYNNLRISSSNVVINCSSFTRNNIISSQMTNLRMSGNIYLNDIQVSSFGGSISGTNSSVVNFYANKIKSETSFSAFTLGAFYNNVLNRGYFNNNTGFSLAGNTIEGNITNTTFNASSTTQRNKFLTNISSLNLATASHIIATYNCDIIYNDAETARLIYLDSADNWVFTTINS